MNKKFMIVGIIGLVLLVITSIVVSYAYFTVPIKTGEENVITSGTMALRFVDGDQVIVNNLIPGEYVEKEFSVENTGNVATTYDVYLSEVINNFADKTDLVYELTSIDGYNTSNQVQVPNKSSKIISNYSIGVGETHHYKLKITFLNKNENQDDNQGKIFKAKIQVNEYREIETTVNYYLGNELVATMPDSDHRLINSTCDKGANIVFDNQNWTYEIENLTEKNTTCNMYFENKFRLTVNNGTGSGLYDYGENTTISATIPNPTVSNYTDNRTCTEDILNATRSQTQTSYTFKEWNDGDINQTRNIVVNENQTYTATFNSTNSQVNTQTCKITKPAADGWYSYSGSLSFAYKQPNAAGYSGGWKRLNEDGTVSGISTAWKVWAEDGVVHVCKVSQTNAGWLYQIKICGNVWHQLDHLNVGECELFGDQADVSCISTYHNEPVPAQYGWVNN